MRMCYIGPLFFIFILFSHAQIWQCPITRGSVEKEKINSDYGPRVKTDPLMSWFHKGIDLGYPNWTPVYAVERGKAVVYSENGVRWVVEITHPSSFFPRTTSYLHLIALADTFFVNDTLRKDSIPVGRGDKIGYVGLGHLHFQFQPYKARAPSYSPLRFLPYDNANHPGPIEFKKPLPNETVFGVYTLGNLLNFFRISIIILV